MSVIPALSIYAVKSKLLFEYSVALSPVVSLNTVLLKSSNALSFVAMGHRMHLCRRFPINSWRPTRAKTARAKTVRIMTSTIFFTDWIKAATMVFKPGEIQLIETGTNSFFPVVSGQLTWNHSNCFEGAKHTERPEGGDVAQVDELGDVPGRQRRGGAQFSHETTTRQKETDPLVHLRHTDHHEIQPIPWVSKECKRSHTETSGQHLDRCLKGVDASKNIPGKKNNSTKKCEASDVTKKAAVTLTLLFYSTLGGCSSS